MLQLFDTSQRSEGEGGRVVEACFFSAVGGLHSVLWSGARASGTIDFVDVKVVHVTRTPQVDVPGDSIHVVIMKLISFLPKIRITTRRADALRHSASGGPRHNRHLAARVTQWHTPRVSRARPRGGGGDYRSA